MKVSKFKKITIFVSVVILLVALAVTFCDALIPLNIWLHPALTFLFVTFVGFGVLCMIVAFVKYSAWYFFLSFIMLASALTYALFSEGLPWWLILITDGVLAAIAISVSLITNGSVAEYADNETAEYENYKQRAEKKDGLQSGGSDITEVKSFKEEKNG